MLMRARLVGLHSGFSEQFVDLCCAAFEYYEAGRSCRLLGLSGNTAINKPATLSFLGTAIWDHLRVNPSYSRRDALVWGLEQLTKGRSFQDQQMAPTVWQRFLAKDDRLRELTEELEQHGSRSRVRCGDMMASWRTPLGRRSNGHFGCSGNG